MKAICRRCFRAIEIFCWAYDAKNLQELAKNLLKSLDGIPIHEQFRLRNVRKVQFLPKRNRLYGRLLPYGRARGYVIQISQKESDRSQANSVGHELGHTFFQWFNGHHVRRPLACKRCGAEEVVCEYFGVRWAGKASNLRDVTKLLRSIERMPQRGWTVPAAD